jgi:molybdopterin/thiamine biosynthesis adenylyltransferase/rhodanese-related sulfurtransferase/molybdopterin converting factor small subunit
MTVAISIPGALRQRMGGKEEFFTQARTVREAINSLIKEYPQLREYLFSDNDRLRNFINLYVNDEDIRTTGGLDTRLKDGDIIIIVPSIAGGSSGDLSTKEMMRYDRHLIMPEVGFEGQKRLKSSSVLVVGVGGLGTPASTYLAAAGIGRIGLIDFDRVEMSNLHRQVLYTEEDIGRPKVEVAKVRLLTVNPNVHVDSYQTKLDSTNALKILNDYDVILDGTDNFPTRYLVNDASVLLKKPVVHASIFRFEGQVTVFLPTKGPCYRCLYPEPPPPGLVPTCAEGGVFGVLPSVIGSIQAIETIKLVLGIGEPLIGRLLMFDALKMKFRELRLRRDESCPVCGSNPTIRDLIDYDEFCGVHSADRQDAQEIEVETLIQWLKEGRQLQVLDVREPWEYNISHIPNAKLIPLSELRSRINELDPEELIVAYCKNGGRSSVAVKYLSEHGFKQIKNLRGGIDLWAKLNRN